jgi:penicillin amidase
MQVLKLLLGIIIAIILFFAIRFLDKPQTLGDESIPALGKLLNPYVGFWQNAESVAEMPTSLSGMRGLDADVNIYYDERMVPHIFANSTKDALFAQGYVTAANRLFQMDLSSRATEGRLSEILGPDLLEKDMAQRRKGMVFAAENAVKEWSKNELGNILLAAYCKGVNAYIKSLSPKDYPLEYKLLGINPEEWSTMKTALFVKAMAASLAERHHDIEATNALKKFNRDTFDFIYPAYFKEETPIIPITKKWEFETIPIEEDGVDNDVIDYFKYEDYERAPDGIGSNNWVVSGTKTKSGDPILCGDPHLGLTLPAIWYEMQIHTPEFNSYGVSLPGIPFIIIGFNENIAWTQTNVGHDVADLYKLTWKDATKMEYLYDGEYKKVELRVDEYQVKGVGTVKDTVRYTIWGPVQFESPRSMDKDLAYKWLGHHSSNEKEITTFYDLNKAKNFDEYYAALNNYNLPAQNYAFASREGDIGIRVAGEFPLKEQKQGRFVRDGSLSSSDWKGFIPKEHGPFTKNPPQGFVASANQHSTDPRYPYYYNREHFESFRGRIINRFLSEKEDFTVQDMMDFQNSNYDLKAEEALPLMLQYLNESEANNNKEIIELLKNWDYTFRADTKVGTFFQTWWRYLHHDVWDETKSDDVPLLKVSGIRTIHLMRDMPESIFFDDINTTKPELINDIVTNSFVKAKAKLGEDIPEWTNYQKPTIHHLAKIPAFSRLTTVGGVHSALNAQTDKHGPSWRQIVVLGDEVKAFVSYPGGQSGNPGSKYYDNFINTWADGKYYEAMFMKSESDYSDSMVSKQVLRK